MELPLQLPYPEASTVCDAKGRIVAECIDNEAAKTIVEAVNQVPHFAEFLEGVATDMGCNAGNWDGGSIANCEHCFLSDWATRLYKAVGLKD